MLVELSEVTRNGLKTKEIWNRDTLVSKGEKLFGIGHGKDFFG